MNGRCQVGEQMVLYSWPVTVLSQCSYSNLKTSVGSSRQTLSHASSSLSFLTLSVPGRPNPSGGLLSSLHVSSSFQKSTAFLKPTLWTWVITVALLPESRHSRHSAPFLYWLEYVLVPLPNNRTNTQHSVSSVRRAHFKGNFMDGFWWKVFQLCHYFDPWLNNISQSVKKKKGLCEGRAPEDSTEGQ